MSWAKSVLPSGSATQFQPCDVINISVYLFSLTSFFRWGRTYTSVVSWNGSSSPFLSTRNVQNSEPSGTGYCGDDITWTGVTRGPTARGGIVRAQTCEMRVLREMRVNLNVLAKSVGVGANDARPSILLDGLAMHELPRAKDCWVKALLDFATCGSTGMATRPDIWHDSF
jgi:hypothetical protein